MWLLTPEVRARLETALNSGAAPTAQQQAEYEARIRGEEDGEDGRSSRILTTAGASAEIRIEGVMTKRPDFMSMLFGGGNTTYGDIITALATAEADESIKDVSYRIDSPGGAFDGLFDVIAAMQAAKKPSRAIINGTGASAAYAIASQADEIVATNRAARIGSIGVAVEMRIREDSVTVSSTSSPNKRPNPETEEGRAVVREELDAMYDIFVDAIATGRGVTASEVTAGFGQGSTYLADKALKRGMIDRIGATALKSVGTADTTTASSGGTQPAEASNMDLKTLKAQHPDVFEAAMQEGVTAERDRVTAHLTMGATAGIMDTAIKAIKDGEAMTMTLQSEYMAAGMNRRDTDDRAGDEAAAAAAADGAAKTPEADESTRDAKAASDIWAFATEQCGVEMEGVTHG